MTLLDDNKKHQIQQRNLNYLAKFYSEEGYTTREINVSLRSWILKQDPNFDLVDNIIMLRRAISFEKKYSLRKTIPIAITQHELNEIKKLDNYDYQKIAFTMLVVSIFFKFNISRKKPNVEPSSFGVYCNANFKDICCLAQVRLTKKQMNECKHTLYLAGLIEPILGSKNPNSLRINYYDEDQSNPVFIVEDYRNVVAYYQQYCGEKIIRCIHCDMMMERRSSTHKMCKVCFDKKRLEQKRNLEKKYRNARKIVDKRIETSCDYESYK